MTTPPGISAMVSTWRNGNPCVRPGLYAGGYSRPPGMFLDHHHCLDMTGACLLAALHPLPQEFLLINALWGVAFLVVATWLFIKYETTEGERPSRDMVHTETCREC